jgi:hypothetical protein
MPAKPEAPSARPPRVDGFLPLPVPVFLAGWLRSVLGLPAPGAVTDAEAPHLLVVQVGDDRGRRFWFDYVMNRPE